MEALRGMARNLMISRAVAGSNSDGMMRFTEAQFRDYTSRILENYAKQRRVARAAGLGLAGVAALTLAGCGIHRLNASTRSDD